MNKQCESCPFLDGMTRGASYAQDMGCLPSAQQILRMRDEGRVNWACHSNQEIACVGLTKERSFDVDVPLLTEDGLAQACTIARIVAS